MPPLKDLTPASRLIPFLDLTRLIDGDSSEKVASFCKTAITPFGNVAAVCVYTEFVEIAAYQTADSNVKVATVCNFPAGNTPAGAVGEKITDAIRHGADEIDVVMPYSLLTEGKDGEVFAFVSHCRKSCGDNITLKVIIESGELNDSSLINRASEIVIEAGGNFIKTSTGKTNTGATEEAVKTILTSIKNSNKNVGIKISGGIKTVEDAYKYVDLVTSIMGKSWLSPENFRIGASSLLDDILLTENHTTQV